MLVVPPMLPRNFLPGLSKPTEASTNGEADSASSIYARAAASSALASQASLMAGLTPSPAAAAAPGAADPHAALLESILAQEQRKQALLASQLSALNANATASDRIGALLLQREGLLGGGAIGLGALEQSALARVAASGGFGASLGLAGLGGLHGLGPGAASQLALMTGAQPQLAGLRDASTLVPDHLAPLLENSDRTGRKGRTGTFPQKLHLMLSDLENEEGGRDIASWLPHGRAFAIHKPKEFVKSVMPKYFRMSRFSSFQRQLNLYEFQRITEGPDKGAYFHELFLHGRPMLCTQIKRNKIKGTQGGRPANNQNAPLGPAFGVFPIPSAPATKTASSAPSPTTGTAPS